MKTIPDQEARGGTSAAPKAAARRQNKAGRVRRRKLLKAKTAAKACTIKTAAKNAAAKSATNRFDMEGLAHHMDILALAEIPPDKNTSDEDTTCNDAYTTCSACSASKQSAGLCEKCHKETIDYYKQGCGEQDEEREAEEETEDEEEMEDEEDEDREEDEGTEKETKENSTVSSAGGANAPNAAVYSGANALTAFVELLCQQVHTPGCMGSGEEVQQAKRVRTRGGRNHSWYLRFYRRHRTTRRLRQYRPPAAVRT